MKYKQPYPPRRTAIALAITASIGGLSLPNTAFSDVYTWGVMTGDSALTTTCAASPDALPVLFTMLTSAGAALDNTSGTKGTNRFQTATCGTLSYDTATQSGTMSIGAFDFFSGTSPAVAAGITIDRVPAGLDDGSGNLLLTNMLFNWSGNNGIPVSISMDAGPLFNEMDGTPTTFTLTDEGSGVITVAPTGTSPLDAGESSTPPASDGTYTDATWGYLAVGPVPLASTEWNTTNVAGCTYASCMGVSPSADINSSSAVEDLAANGNEYTKGDGVGVGGNPMQDGPFIDFNANFDFTSMTLTSFTDTTKPVLSMNGAATINLTQGDAYTELSAGCTDAAPLNTVIPVTPGGDTVDTNTVAKYIVTYNCADSSGNAATQQSRTVNVSAADTPEITLLGVTPVTHECAITYSDAGATAVAGDGTTDISDDILTNINATNPDISTVASYTLHYDVNDGFKDAVTVPRTVDVVDTTKPVVTLIGSSPENVASSTPQNAAIFTDQGATVTDSCDTTLSSPIAATSGSVATMVVPDTGPDTIPYSLTYAVTDITGTPGNTGTTSRTVNVVRSQPVVNLNGSQTVVIANVGDTYTEEGMDIHDVQDGNELGVVADGAAASGLTYSISGTVDTNTNGIYLLTYSATDSVGNIATSVTREVKVGVYAVGSNFTMLDASGKVFGGTNDVVFSWDETENTAETDLNFNMTIASALPQPFFGAVWTAHHTRAFGPGTYSFDTGCTVAEIEATGCAAETAAASGAAMSMTVADGQVGAHILFDYNGTYNIDVVVVWDRDAIWNDPDGEESTTNNLHDGLAGLAPDPAAPWKLVSRDVNGDGINGTPMVDGPFKGFYANFNAGPGGTVKPPEPITTTVRDTVIGGGAISWLVLLGTLPLISLFRMRMK